MQIRIHNFDGKRYVALGDLWALAHKCALKAREGVEPGYICEDKECRMSAEHAYRHLLAVIMWDEIHAAINPDDIKKMHRDLWKEYYAGRYAIKGQGVNGKAVYFWKYCGRAQEGEETPVFTEKRKEAALFDDHACACAVRDSIKQNYGMDNIEVIEGFMLDNELCKVLLNAIFGGENGSDKED